MHELSLCQAIVDRVIERAADRPVRRVTVQIGHLRQVVPDSLQFSWQLLTESSPLEGAELAIDHVPAVVACSVCEARTTLDLPVLACGRCGTDDVDLVSGEEFAIVAFEVEAIVP
jgi:hydrogenase nickel incorporation protein HypA/HybF